MNLLKDVEDETSLVVPNEKLRTSIFSKLRQGIEKNPESAGQIFKTLAASNISPTIQQQLLTPTLTTAGGFSVDDLR